MIRVSQLRLMILGLIGFSLTALLSSCSSGGGGSSSQAGISVKGSQSSGSVALLLTDAPTNEFDQIKIKVTSAELLGEDSRIEIFNDPEGTVIDLLSLRSESTLLSISENVPVGEYHKIRLSVTEVLLCELDEDGNVAREEVAKLPANGKIDLNPRGSFRVEQGETLVIQLDLDANNSIHVVGAGNGNNGRRRYIFRPQVYVSIIAERLEGKLVRLTGKIEELDLAAGTFKLCPEGTSFGDAIELGADDDSAEEDNSGNNNNNAEVRGRPSRSSSKTSRSSRSTSRTSDGRPDADPEAEPEDKCVTVLVEESTCIFNYNGELIAADQLIDGDKVTVMGHMRFRTLDNSEEEEPDSGTLPDLRPNNQLVLDSTVIELWIDEDTQPFHKINGTIVSSVDDDGVFKFEVPEGQIFIGEDRTIEARLADGAKIFNRNGELLVPANIEEGLEATLEAALVLSDTEADHLLVPIMMIDTEDGPEPTKISGTVASVDVENSTLVLSIPGEEGEEPTEQCVEITSETELFRITIVLDGFVSILIDLSDIVDGQYVEIFGQPMEDPDCFVSTTVLVLDSEEETEEDPPVPAGETAE